MSDTYELTLSEMIHYKVSVEADTYMEDAMEKFNNGSHSETYNEEIIDHQVESVQNLDAKDRSDQFMQSMGLK